MPKLTTEQKLFIVGRLACFDSLSEIVAAFKETFGVEIGANQVWSYDPTRPGYDMDPKWREVHAKTRKEFLENIGDIPIAHKSVRLQRLEQNYRLAAARKNLPLANGILEQAAKEVGDAYSNKRRVEHTGKDGGAIETRGESTVNLNGLESLPDNVRAAIRAAMGGTGDAGPGAAEQGPSADPS